MPIAPPAAAKMRASANISMNDSGVKMRKTAYERTSKMSVCTKPRPMPARNLPVKSCPGVSRVVSSLSSVPLRLSSTIDLAPMVMAKRTYMVTMPGRNSLTGSGLLPTSCSCTVTAGALSAGVQRTAAPCW